MALKISMHNWMRPEPIETTITRLGRSGYDGIEISGEPALYDADQVKAPARRQRPGVLGLGDADDGRPRPRARGLLRPHGERAVRQGHALAGLRPRREDPHRRAVDGRQGRADGLAGGGVAVGRRGPEGVPGARGAGRRADRHRAAQPLRDLLHQPRRPGGAARQGRRRQLRRHARHLPHEHRGGRLGAGDPRHRRPASSTSTSPTTTACRAARARSTGRRSSARSARSATTTTSRSSSSSPVDRSPLSQRTEIADAADAGASQGMEQFLRDHGTGTLPEHYYDRYVQDSIDRLRTAIDAVGAAA